MVTIAILAGSRKRMTFLLKDGHKKSSQNKIDYTKY